MAVCLNQYGKAEGDLYIDSGEGWSFQQGDYALLHCTAEQKGSFVYIKINQESGKRNIKDEIKGLNIELLSKGRVYNKSSGSISQKICILVKGRVVIKK